VYVGPRGYSLSWSRSQKSGQVHSASSAVQGASASGSSARSCSVVISVSRISCISSPSVEPFVGGQGQEVLELLGERDRGEELLRLVAEHAVEDLGAGGDEIGVRDPGPVEAVARLALLVLAHLRERELVRLRVLARRDVCRHAADRVRAAAVTGPHEQLRVGA